MKIQDKRLLRLAENLIIKRSHPGIIKLKHVSNFIFEIGNRQFEFEPLVLGYVKELPKIFPYEWLRNYNGEYYWKNDPDRMLLTSLGLFFGIDFHMVGHLFIPQAQIIASFGGQSLSSTATYREIAYNIHRLLESKDIWLDLPDDFDIRLSKN